MSKEPTYPADAVPGRVTPPPALAPASPPATTLVDGVTEQARSLAGSANEAARNVNWQKVGVGVGAAIGIGSAAVAAALLYANRSNKA